MKLSYRDKVIFICAIVAIILVAGFFLFIKPKYDEMTVAKSYLQDKETEKAGIEEKINTLPDLVDQVKEVAKSVDEKQDRFVMYQDTYHNDRIIREFLDGIDLDVMSLNMDYVRPESVVGYVVNPENIYTYDFLMQGDIYGELPQDVIDVYNGNDERKGESFRVGVTTASIILRDENVDLDNLIKFFDSVSDDERTIRVTNFVKTYTDNFAAGDATIESVETTVNVQIYHIYPLNVEKVMEETDEVEIVPVAEEAAAE